MTLDPNGNHILGKQTLSRPYKFLTVTPTASSYGDKIHWLESTRPGWKIARIKLKKQRKVDRNHCQTACYLTSNSIAGKISVRFFGDATLYTGGKLWLAPPGGGWANSLTSPENLWVIGKLLIFKNPSHLILGPASRWPALRLEEGKI